MRVVLTNFGTVGDVHPYVALAKELQAHHHKPALACSPNFESFIRAHELEFLPLGPDLLKTQQEINNAIIQTPGIEESVGPLYNLFFQLGSAFPQMFSELRDICWSADVLISGPMQPTARMVHEITGIPFVSVQVEHFGGSGTPALRQASAELINPFRGQLGLAPLADPLTSDANSPQLALYAMSRHVSPPPRTWSAHHHMPGYFFLDDPDWQPDAALAEFIAAGEPPVVITFGSMPHADPGRLTEVVLGAVERAGCRAVLQHGWGGLAQHAKEWPPNIHAIDYVNYHWLFSRAACVVHHGGPGTAAAVFRAGVPNVFVPHAWDQPLWAQLAEGLGCAGPTVSYAELDEVRLGAAIRQTLEKNSYARAAAALSEKIRGEAGVRRARELIEQLVSRVGLSEVHPEAAPSLALAQERTLKVSRRKSYQHGQRSRKLIETGFH